MFSVKRDIARRLVMEHLENETGVISIQVLQKFFQVATRKIETPISLEDALQFMQYMSILDTAIADLDMVVAAVRLLQRYSLSFWDSLILQAAKSAGCTQVLSEDLQDDFRVNGLVVRNPFRL